MAGISSQAANTLENNKKYNGIELENDLEIQTYDAFFRELDPQTARWWQVDPVTEGYEDISPYASMYNNPITYSDPLGNEGEGCCKDLLDAVEDVLISASGVVNGMLNSGSGGLIPTDPLNFRNKLSGEKLELYDRSVLVGQVGPGLMPGVASTRTPSMQPVNGPALAVPVTVKPISVPLRPGVQQSSSNNPHGSKGKPDHQQAVKDLTKKAQQEAGTGETVISERKIQGHDSRRRPDVQIVDRNGKTRKVFEAERKPTSKRNIKREEEYRKLKVEQETQKVGG